MQLFHVNMTREEVVKTSEYRRAIERDVYKRQIYMFDRPSIWKWNQEMSDREKFIVATLLVKNSDLEENPGITIRKTGKYSSKDGKRRH